MLRGKGQHLLGAAEESEVAVVGGDLSSAIDRLDRAFYRPGQGKHRIVIPANEFYSDIELAESQVRREQNIRERLSVDQMPANSLTLVHPEKNEIAVTDEDIARVIEAHRGEIALVCLPEVHFLTGIHHDTNRLAALAREVGAYSVADGAHGIGNVKMNWGHEDGPDGGAACTYKYVGGGAGNEAWSFVHRRHGELEDFGVSRGWFSYHPEDRFSHGPDKRLAPGASSLRLGNTNMIAAAVIDDVMKRFVEVGIDQVVDVSQKMVRYFLDLMVDVPESKMKVVTPVEDGRHGAMLTFTFAQDCVGKLKEALAENHVEVDWRDPNIMRASFPAFHTKFTEIFRVAEIMKEALA